LTIYVFLPYSIICNYKKRKNATLHSSFFLHHPRAAYSAVPGSASYFAGFLSIAVTSITMIRKNSLFIKMLKIKTSSKFILQAFMKQFRPELETCPICGSKRMHIHCYYGRSIIDFIGRFPQKDVPCILRLCGGYKTDPEWVLLPLGGINR